jgi:hypothetical protein
VVNRQRFYWWATEPSQHTGQSQALPRTRCPGLGSGAYATHFSVVKGLSVLFCTGDTHPFVERADYSAMTVFRAVLGVAITSDNTFSPGIHSSLCTISKMKFAQNIAYVSFHRVFADHQLLGDFTVPQPLSD